MPLPQRVYIMDCPSAGLYKLGRSWFPRARAVDVKRTVGAPVSVLAEFDVPNAKAEERALHKMFARQRRRFGHGDGCTEWFELSEFDVLLILLCYSSGATVWAEPFSRFADRLASLLKAIGLTAAATVPTRRFLPIWLTGKQAVEVLGRDRRTLNRTIREGKARSIGRGRGWRVYRDDVLALGASVRG
jgi:excisionase family DNA binding protein